MCESESLGLLSSRAEKEWRARMQGAGVSIPDGVTSLRLYRAAGDWMRDELSYFVREEEREACDHLISAEYLPGASLRKWRGVLEFGTPWIGWRGNTDIPQSRSRTEKRRCPWGAALPENARCRS